MGTTNNEDNEDLGMRTEDLEAEGAAKTGVKPNKAGSGRKAAKGSSAAGSESSAGSESGAGSAGGESGAGSESSAGSAGGESSQSGKSAKEEEITVSGGPECGKDGEKPKDGESAAGGAGDSTPEVTPQEQLACERDRYLRLAAEYDNYRKRSAKERETTYQSARADAVTRLLPVYDNLERALKMECSDEPFYKGVEMTMTGLTEILENMGVKRIEAVGEPFDPNRHNAVMSIENPDFGKNTVAEEFQKGFTLGDKVIRHSTVVVAN